MNIKLINSAKIFFILSMHIIFADPTNGQQEIENIKTQRILGEHYFTMSNQLSSPFILTHAVTSIGVGGISNLKYPLIEINDSEFTYLQGDLFMALLSFEYQHAAKDWLALFLRFDLASRLGSDFGTLVTEGINYSTTFNIGWMIRVLRTNKFALSATIEVTNGDYSVISIKQFVDDIEQEVANPSLIVSNTAMYGIAGIKTSYGISRFLGFSGEVDLGYGEPIQKDMDNEVFVNAGVEADMNFYRPLKVPVSLTFGYLYSSYPRNNNNVFYDTNIFYTQVNYIGRPDFILSLDFTFSRELSTVDGAPIWPITLLFSMRYLF